MSELMLQQTQVVRVIPKYHAFLARFPTVGSCAAAAAGDVVQLWAGLGYNRRALNLHRCAGVVVAEHGGALPRSIGELMALPGIGPYTARAVAAFAFAADVGVVDTNAARVLARWAGRPLRKAEAQAQADQAVPPGQGWAWNQAVLDLGATVCTIRSPSCGECPVASTCAWAVAGRPDPDPAVGTAGSSRPQSRFDGSDRQGRGRLVDALRAGPVRAEPEVLAEVMGWPGDPDRATRVARTLLDDGLAVEVGSATAVWLELPSVSSPPEPTLL
ncbi:MAG TPA: A/G-specific adenine glycosylase [Acidimicrobiales bacterium]|nr:A/G-specific adenine glycosylase [Acidimicrobiales bacterium]